MPAVETGAEKDQEPLWQSFKREADSVCLDDQNAVIALAVHLIADWGSSRAEMRRILLHGVLAAELKEEVLKGWDARFDRMGSQGATQGPDQPETQPSPLPPELLPFDRAIGEHSRKHGRGALAMGRELLAARAQCEQCGCGFETFLAYLHRRHGLNRATCYMYMKFAQWELPDGLGTAVMKWIVQGFAQGSMLAQQIIQVAVAEELSLDALQVRYGALRGRTSPQHRTGASSDSSALVKKLHRKRQRLLSQRQKLDDELMDVDAQLKQLDVPALPPVAYVASYDSASAANRKKAGGRSC